MQYEVKGGNMPVVICHLEAGEKMITEKGSMVWMSRNMKMETTGGGMGKMFGRMLTGESMFRNIYTAEGGNGMIAFASSFPGSILAIEVTPDKPVVMQKSAFLAATSGVEMSVFFQKKFASAMFGGEGFLMQEISGNGIVFAEVDGSAVEYELKSGQQLVVDTGNLAIMDSTVSIDIESVKGVKNVLFGGEGLFNTVLTGPGKVTLQTMPLNNFVGLVASRIPSNNG